MSLRTKIRLVPLAVEAGWWLCVAWLLLDVLPGKLYRRILPSSRVPQPIETYDSARHDARASRISGVIQYMAQRLPFHPVCFPQGIAADKMLQRRGIAHVMHYGVMREGGELKAHVWVTASGQGVIGVPAAKPFTEVAQYVTETH